MSPVLVLLSALLLALLSAGPSAQAQQPAAGAAPTVKAVPSEYRLGAGDVVRIVVFQNADLTLETRITEAGVVRNGNFVKSPQVTLVVLQVRGNQVSVLGQVNRPGRYPLEVADMRLSEVLALAGGTAPNGADVLVVTGTRNGQPFRQEVDFPTLFAPGNAAKDFVMLNGDTVWVERQPIVYIYGEVQRPGPMRLEREMTLLQALATGGGLTQRGTDKGIRVHRKGSDGKVQVVEPVMTDMLREGDVVFVRESLF